MEKDAAGVSNAIGELPTLDELLVALKSFAYASIAPWHAVSVNTWRFA